ncbi:hypothetical protein [Bacillus sp. S/N-304-OC-R1]|uniref:hypothetical protein n=1 Tax=Bacillus sp. S/N-304-OC-R1 TaxID=2758034 RepID=UPI001C8E48DC|nr:hypothetical protein [Bacillus sp. S/N-304-OC-R1]MBY0123041.1 hypothetical protein [Bacillus sp. S/N-304-OC-R1]
MSDVLFQMIAFGSLTIPILITIIVVIFIVRIVRRMERRADERLKLDKENAQFQQQQMQAIQELNLRLTNIEKLLKDVE